MRKETTLSAERCWHSGFRGRLLTSLAVLVAWTMFPCQIHAATVYWDRCSAFCCDDVPMYGDFEPAHRPNVCILSVLVIGSNNGIPSVEWHSILVFTAEYDLENEVVTYSGGVNGSAKFGETVRLHYSTLMVEDGKTPAVGYADFRYEDDPTFDVLIDSSYVSIGPIPEPSGGVLLALGIGIVLLRRHRK